MILAILLCTIAQSSTPPKVEPLPTVFKRYSIPGEVLTFSPNLRDSLLLVDQAGGSREDVLAGIAASTGGKWEKAKGLRRLVLDLSGTQSEKLTLNGYKNGLKLLAKATDSIWNADHPEVEIQKSYERLKMHPESEHFYTPGALLARKLLILLGAERLSNLKLGARIAFSDKPNELQEALPTAANVEIQRCLDLNSALLPIANLDDPSPFVTLWKNWAQRIKPGQGYSKLILTLQRIHVGIVAVLWMYDANGHPIESVVESVDWTPEVNRKPLSINPEPVTLQRWEAEYLQTLGAGYVSGKISEPSAVELKKQLATKDFEPLQEFASVLFEGIRPKLDQRSVVFCMADDEVRILEGYKSSDRIDLKTFLELGISSGLISIIDGGKYVAIGPGPAITGFPNIDRPTLRKLIASCIKDDPDIVYRVCDHLGATQDGTIDKPVDNAVLHLVESLFDVEALTYTHWASQLVGIATNVNSLSVKNSGATWPFAVMNANTKSAVLNFIPSSTPYITESDDRDTFSGQDLKYSATEWLAASPTQVVLDCEPAQYQRIIVAKEQEMPPFDEWPLGSIAMDPYLFSRQLSEIKKQRPITSLEELKDIKFVVLNGPGIICGLSNGSEVRRRTEIFIPRRLHRPPPVNYADLPKAFRDAAEKALK